MDEPSDSSRRSDAPPEGKTAAASLEEGTSASTSSSPRSSTTRAGPHTTATTEHHIQHDEAEMEDAKSAAAPLPPPAPLVGPASVAQGEASLVASTEAPTKDVVVNCPLCFEDRPSSSMRSINEWYVHSKD